MKATLHPRPIIGILLFAAAHLSAQSVGNYVFSTGTGATLNSMTGATTLTFGSNDDDVTGLLPMGFNFVFEGISYADYSVSTDGFIRLGTAGAVVDWTNDLAENSNLPRLAALWDDHHFGNTNTGSVKTLLTGSAPNRIRIIQWFVTIPRNSGGTANGTFQLWLYETTNVIEFRYGSASNPNSASVGLSGASSSPVQFLSVTTSDHTVSSITSNNNNTSWPGSGRKYTFTPPSLPNLALLAPPSVSQSGTNISASFTVVNNGTAQADETWASVYLLNTATGQAAMTLGQRKINALPISQTQNVSFSFDICRARLQPNQPYRVAYTLDFSNALLESNEADNMGTATAIPISVGPDPALPTPSGTGGNATADNLINQFLQTWRVPGAAVAVARQGKMFYEKGFGHADCAQAPVLPTTRFRAPGISNTLTAAAIHKLIQDGQITLNSKVFGTGGILWANSYFAGTPLADPRMADITVRHLLEHTSLWEDEGLCFPTPNQYPLPGGFFLGFLCDPDTYPLTVAAFLNESNPASRRATIKYALQNIPLSGPPGSAHDFSNINYATLAQIIEVKTGQNYANWVKNNILAPAGVCDMEIGGARLSNKLPREAEYFSPNTQLSASGSGFDYVQYGGFWLPSMDAHSGWVGTAAEWLRFLLSIDGLPTKPDPVLTMSSVSAMSQPSPNNPAFGRGWQLDGQGNWFFTGQIAGSAAHFMRKPDGTALVILLNSSEGFSPDDLKNLMQNCANALPGGTPAIDLLAGTVPSGPISVNGGSTYTYSVAPVNGATSYTWTPPPGVSINGNLAGQAVTLSAAQGTSVSVTFIQGAGSCITKTLCVKANNRCAEGCLTILIN